MCTSRGILAGKGVQERQSQKEEDPDRKMRF